MGAHWPDRGLGRVPRCSPTQESTTKIAVQLYSGLSVQVIVFLFVGSVYSLAMVVGIFFLREETENEHGK
jgi:hypothetical protein